MQINCKLLHMGTFVCIEANSDDRWNLLMVLIKITLFYARVLINFHQIRNGWPYVLTVRFYNTKLAFQNYDCSFVVKFTHLLKIYFIYLVFVNLYMVLVLTI